MAAPTQNMRDFRAMATGRRPLQYSEPSLKGVPPSASTKFQAEPPLSPSSGGHASTHSLATMVLPESPNMRDHTWTSRLEGLRNDLAATRLDLQNDLTKQERNRLMDRIVSLEGDVRALQQEAEQWRQRCLESERDRAEAAASEDRAQLELRDAHARERELAQRSVELRLHKAEMEHSVAHNELEVQKHQQELWRREQELSAKDEEIKSLKDDLSRVRACSQSQDSMLRVKDAELEATKADLRRLRETSERQQEMLQKMEADLKATRHELREAIEFGETRRQALERIEWDHAEQLEQERHSRLVALNDAKEHAEGLSARIRELEATLNAANLKHADATREAECFRTKSEHLDEVNRKLRFDLQESIGHGVRSGGVPFYHDGPSRAIAGSEDRDISLPRPPDLDATIPRPPAQVPPSPRLSSLPLSPPKSRLDYPRNSTSRRLRREVLTARGAGRYDDPLSQTSYSTHGWSTLSP